MKRFVKLVSTVTMAAMLLGLVGCGTSTTGTTSTTSTTIANTASEAPATQESQAGSTAVSTSGTNSKDLKVSISDVPAKAILTPLLDAMQAEYTEGKITYEILPAARAFNDLKSGASDMLTPYIYDPAVVDDSIIFGSIPLYDTIFVLYTNKSNKEINTENLYNYKIEVHPAHSAHFNNSPESDPEGGLQKVDAGRLDGYITSMGVGDAAIQKLNLKNIKRWSFKTFGGGFIFANTDKGRETEKTVASLILKLKANGKFQEILKSRLNATFVEDPS